MLCDIRYRLFLGLFDLENSDQYVVLELVKLNQHNFAQHSRRTRDTSGRKFVYFNIGFIKINF